MRYGHSREDAMKMTSSERTEWLIAHGQQYGGVYEYDERRWLVKPRMG